MNRVSAAGTVTVSEAYGDVLVAPVAARPVTGGHYPYAIDYVVMPTRKSSWGSLADLGSAPSAEDIDEMRREIWGGFSREDG